MSPSRVALVVVVVSVVTLAVCVFVLHQMIHAQLWMGI